MLNNYNLLFILNSLNNNQTITIILHQAMSNLETNKICYNSFKLTYKVFCSILSDSKALIQSYFQFKFKTKKCHTQLQPILFLDKKD